LLAIAREITQAEIVGCTSAGEITEAGLIHGGVAIMLVASDATIDMRFATGLKSDPEKVARELSSNLAAAKKAAAAHERRSLTTVLLTDGLAGTGERLVNELYERRVQSGTQIVGGAAGDEGRFAATWVGSGAGASSDSAVALHIFSESPWGIGVDHGLRPTTKQMRVTMAEGNVVHEIDGQPAFAAYQRHAAARNVRLTPENASPYLIANELGVHFFERIGRARAPLSVGPNGSLVCAADVPKGSMVSILDGEPDSMILAAQAAAKAARASVHGPVAGVLLFDCVCRGMILKDAFRLEVEAIRTTFPGAPIAGLLTYGEIARSHDRLNGWNNATAVVVAIPA
jgi:methyl-accepting chemotaxis protein